MQARTFETDIHRFLADGIGLWEERRTSCDFTGQPAAFLDRDGVVMEEAHFPRKRSDVRLTPRCGEAIVRLNEAGIAVVLVTNQSGVARGILGWEEFAQVQDELLCQLSAMAGVVDAVFACGYHEDGVPPYQVTNHSWRKPAPGMLLRAMELLDIDVKSSIMIGDRITDLQAGQRAGLSHGVLVNTGFGGGQQNKFAAQLPLWKQQDFTTSSETTLADAIDTWLRSP